MFCLLRNNKETAKNDADAEELRKLVTETTDDADAQARMDALLNELNDKDPFTDLMQNKLCTDMIQTAPVNFNALRYRMVVSQSNIDKSEFSCNL